LTYLHGSLLETLSVIDALLASNVLFLVLDQLTIKAIHQLVNGGVHVGVLGLGHQISTGNVQGAFGFLLQLVHLKGDVGAR